MIMIGLNKNMEINEEINICETNADLYMDFHF